MREAVHARIDIGLKVLATVIAMFGVVKYFHALGVAEDLARKGESRAVIAAYSSENMQVARTALVHFWVGQPSFLGMEDVANGASGRAYFALARKKLANGDEALWQSLFTVSSYFDDAWFCRSSTLCDQEILDEFVCSKSLAINKTYREFFNAMNVQLRASSFGKSLAKYSGVCLG
ncbi:hypothetical protein [Tranquillimonas rosea]|uniref:hypothetical protein n=1 Tax=Tranquillimonas rosea TaxID=641238 RepID=UPI001160A11C|nr:hypothetical protein [Tranquillimonas rosea]